MFAKINSPKVTQRVGIIAQARPATPEPTLLTTIWIYFIIS